LLKRKSVSKTRTFSYKKEIIQINNLYVSKKYCHSVVAHRSLLSNLSNQIDKTQTKNLTKKWRILGIVGVDGNVGLVKFKVNYITIKL